MKICDDRKKGYKPFILHVVPARGGVHRIVPKAFAEFPAAGSPAADELRGCEGAAAAEIDSALCEHRLKIGHVHVRATSDQSLLERYNAGARGEGDLAPPAGWIGSRPPARQRR